MRSAWFALFLFVVAGGCAADPTQRSFTPVPDLVSRDTVTAFVDVHVVPMDRPRILRNQTVVVREGRIVEIGPTAELTPPAGAVVIEGDDRYLMPGLADMHVHMLHAEDMLLYVANGVTTVRNMWGHNLILGWRDAAASGTVLGPRIYSASHGLDGPAPVWETTVVVDDPADAERAVAAEVAQGFDFIKVYNSLSPAAYDAIVAAARARGIPVVGHVPGRVGLSHVLAQGQASMEHLIGYDLDLSDGALAAIARQTADARVWVSPTMIVLISFVNTADAAEIAARPEMRYVHPAIRERWIANPQAAPRSQQRQVSARRGRVVRALLDAGAGVLLGTDAWISYVAPGFSIHDELMLLVEDAGFSPFEAIRAGTADAARFLGAENAFGRIAEGLAADFILVHGNPLDDVSHVKLRSGVMVGGDWYSEDELVRLLEEQAGRFDDLSGGEGLGVEGR